VIAVRGWGLLNYILLDNPELQEAKEKVQSINEIYTKQVRDGVEITDLTNLNTDKGVMGLCMDMFLDHKRSRKMHLGSYLQSKRRRGAVKQDWYSARMLADLVDITDGYAIGPECLAWEIRTGFKNERKVKAKAKERAGR
jgi:hypothetical protein